MATPPAEAKDFHILVVDDEANIREIVSELITLQGYRATAVSGGQEALKMLTQETIHLVITDLMMPHMNGWQLLGLIKKKYPKMPVIVLTGYISEEGEEMLTNSQSNGYLTKPIDQNKLRQMLADFHQKSQSRQKPHIAILDDDAVTLNALEHALGQNNYEVVTFQDPDKALQHIKKNGPDLLILDLLLQDRNGFEICEILKSDEQTARLPILILTAAPSKENVVKAIQLNVSGFVAKPFDPKAILERVQKILNNTSSANG